MKCSERSTHGGEGSAEKHTIFFFRALLANKKAKEMHTYHPNTYMYKERNSELK